MATSIARKASNEARSKSKLPLDQFEELEKKGRCRRIVCDILTLRVLGYIVKQPASFMFIITLFAISVCLPFIGLYIKGQKDLPDLDAMQVGYRDMTVHNLGVYNEFIHYWPRPYCTSV